MAASSSTVPIGAILVDSSTPAAATALKRCKPGNCDVKLWTKGLEAVSRIDWKAALYLLSLFRTRLDPPTGMLAGVLMGKIRSGIETGVRENLKTARERLAAAR
jgi:hypothetical protein